MCSLLRLPTRTPLLIVSSSYQAPWDINPWQDSNVELMKKLGDHAFRIKSIEAAGTSVASHWIEFEDAISQLDQSAQSDKPLLIYLNLHGVIDPDERPCLIYRESSPLEVESWIPFEELLRSIESALRQPRSIVFLCESSRQDAPWQSVNEFSSSLHRLFESYPKTGKINSLVGICTTRSTPFENISHEKGDHFTRLLAQGLAGQCDRKENGGNSDRHVDLSELQSYIETHFAVGSGIGFKAEPNTRLLSSAPFHSPLAWAGLTNPYKASQNISNAQTFHSDAVASMWSELHTVHSERVWRNHPAYWSLLKQTAIDLEAMHHSHHPNSVRIAELQRTLERLQRKCQEPLLDPKDSPNVHLTEQISRSLEVWAGVAVNPTVEKLKQLLEKWDQNTRESDYHPTPFLYTLLQQTDSAIWARPDLLQSFARGMVLFESARLDSFLLPSLLELEDRERSLDNIRRGIEDRFLAGDIDNETIERLNTFELECTQYKSSITVLATSVDHYYQALADVLSMVRAGLVIDRYDLRKTESEQPAKASLLRTKLLGLIYTLARNADHLISERGASNTGLFVDVEASCLSLSEAISAKWLRLIEDGQSVSEERFLAISQLLNSGFIPLGSATPESTNAIRHGSYRVLMNHLASKPNSPFPIAVLSNRTEAMQQEDLDRESHSLLAPLYSKVFQGLVSEGNTDLQAHAVWRSVQRLHKSASLRFDDSAIKHSMAARLLTSQFGLTDCAKWVHTHEARLEEHRAARAINRHTDDFWHTPAREGTSYFVIASDVIKQKIERLVLKPTDYSTKTFEKLDRYRAAGEKFKLSTRYSPAAAIDISPELSWNVENDLGKDSIPSGLGSVRLIKNTGASPELIDKQTVRANADKQSASGKFGLTGLINTSLRNDLNIQFEYRGHRCDSTIRIHSSPSLVSITSTSPAGDAVVRIEETGEAKRYRTLILDCSASMFEQYDAESNQNPNSSPIDRSKLVAAKRAVAEILERWSNQPNHVGVVFFGHRVSAGGEKQGTLIQDKYFAAYPFSPTLQPYEDVETILPVGRFTDVEKSKVLSHLELLLPWGQTPLYLSLQTAIQQAANTTQDGIHDIIVVSDGRNYQFNPHPMANIAIDAVIEMAKRNNTRIHLIGFGIPKSEFAEASEQYQRLAVETGGSASFQIADSVALVERVNSLTQPQPVLVQLPNNDRILASTGTDIVLPRVAQINTPLTVEYKGVTSTFPVSPKSALKLFVSLDNKMSSAQYVASGYPSIHNLITPEQSVSSVQLGVHPLKKNGDGYAWDVSLLSADGGVAPRPKFHLVEIEPKMKTGVSSASGDSPRYVSFNSSWLPNTPHPVMQLQAANWPLDCDQATLSFWCTDQSPSVLDQWIWNPEESSNAEQSVSQSPVKSGTDKPLLVHDLSQHGIRCYARLSERELLLIIYHDDNQCKTCDILPLATLGAAPERTERDYRPLDRLSIHRFFWANQPSPSIRSQKNSLKLVLLDLKSLKSNALHLSRPVTNDVATPILAKPISTSPVIRR
ncbi:MAG: VWA domain-containing protein [Pirellula sp.]|nr:VWA domain-containing protein [Pirellula sp.]